MAARRSVCGRSVGVSVRRRGAKMNIDLRSFARENLKTASLRHCVTVSLRE